MENSKSILMKNPYQKHIQGHRTISDAILFNKKYPIKKLRTQDNNHPKCTVYGKIKQILFWKGTTRWTFLPITQLLLPSQQ